MMNKLILSIVLTLASTNTLAGSVIVHPSNNSALNQDAIKRIFLGKSKSFTGGGSAVPISLPEESEETAKFNSQILNKSASQLKSYWSKLVFTGKGTPPKNVVDDAEMIALIAANPNMIGYIEGAADANVKVVTSY